jgi:hypothetical protein
MFFLATHPATTRWLTDSTQYTRKSSAEVSIAGAEFYSHAVVCGVNRFTKQTKKAARQQGGLLFTRENSSNGGKKSRQNFLAKSYGPKKGGVKRFLVNKCL